MLKVYEFFVDNWRFITLALLFIFLFSLIKPITNMLRNFKDGIREIFTPLGMFVFLCMIAFGIFLFFVYKGRF